MSARASVPRQWASALRTSDRVNGPVWVAKLGRSTDGLSLIDPVDSATLIATNIEVRVEAGTCAVDTTQEVTASDTELRLAKTTLQRGNRPGLRHLRTSIVSEWRIHCSENSKHY